METQNVNTLFTGKLFISLNETASTNLYLKEWLANNKPTEGAVILAEKQTAGRGQEGTTWLSEPGKNLTLSIYYRPTFLLAQHQFLLSMAVALGVRECVATLLPHQEVSIKWPNDIYVNGCKVSGILIENTLQGQHLSGSVIGIGLNVLQSFNPADLPHASSLKDMGYQSGLQEALKNLLEQVEKHYLRLRGGQQEAIRQEYLQHLFRKGLETTYLDAQGRFYGIIRDVDINGRLHIQTQDGMRTYFHKEVAMVLSELD